MATQIILVSTKDEREVPVSDLMLEKMNYDEKSGLYDQEFKIKEPDVPAEITAKISKVVTPAAKAVLDAAFTAYDISLIPGTGANGSITKADAEAYVALTKEASEEEE